MIEKIKDQLKCDKDEAVNLKSIIMRKAKTYSFNGSSMDDTERAAKSFQAEALLIGLNKVGADVNMKLPHEALDELLKKHGVRIENRKFYGGSEAWRNGFYIIHNNEIAYFISAIVPVIIGKGSFRVMICTNVPMTMSPRFVPVSGPPLNPPKRATIKG